LRVHYTFILLLSNYACAGDQMVLSEGEHCFPFSTVLPTKLPSSFEGEFGHIRYTVKTVIDRPWKFDHEIKSAFTVISAVDLNNHATAKVCVY